MGIVDHPFILVLVLVASWPFYRAFGSLLFRNRDEVHDAVYYWLVPDLVSLFRGEWWEDQLAELKLFVFLVISALVVAAEYTAVTKFMSWLSS